MALNRAFRELVALEHKRVDSADRRTEVALKAIEASSAADERQYNYHLEKLRTTMADRNERRRTVSRIVWTMGSAGAVVSGFLLLMLFFGTDAQRATAMDLLRTVLTGLGGAGILWLVRTLYKRAMNQDRGDL